MSGAFERAETSNHVPLRHCNVCGSMSFEDYGGRALARCTSCDSFERHRVCYEVYRKEGLLERSGPRRRILHLAPERIVHDLLEPVPANDYVCADMAPERYPHAQLIELMVPEGLDRFDDGSFDNVLHNHVWEHLPGTWSDYVEPFLRILRPGGAMIFTFPFRLGVSPATTVEGGENLASDEDRLRVFGQHDHVRVFGHDFLDVLGGWPGTEFSTDGLRDRYKRQIGGFVGESAEMVFTLRKL